MNQQKYLNYEDDFTEEPSTMILTNKDFTQAQKEAIIKVVMDEILCAPLLTPESTESDIHRCIQEWFLSEKQEQKIREELKSGRYVYCGDFYDTALDFSLTQMAKKIWEAMFTADKGDIEVINGDLEDTLSK